MPRPDKGWVALGRFGLISVLVLVLGGWLFRRLQDSFVDYV